MPWLKSKILGEQRWILLLLIVPIVYGAFLALGASGEFPISLTTDSRMPFLYDKPVGEDGYYMLGVAWNFAEGKGLVGNFDQPVTGIQPLATLIYAALAWIMQYLGGGRDEFIRSIILFGALNFALFAHWTGRLAARLADSVATEKSLYAIAVVIVCSSFYLFRVFNYGLETGIYLTLLLLVFNRYLDLCDALEKTGSITVRSSVVLGLMIGLTGLARIDFGVLYFFLIAWVFYKNRPLVPSLLLAGLVASIVATPWFLHVYSVSGTIMPSSGPAQAALISWDKLDGRLIAVMHALVQNLMPTVYVGNRWYTLLAGSIALGVVAFFAWKERGFKLSLKGVDDWLVPIGLLVVTYFLFFWSTHFYTRYSAPIVIPAVLVLALAVNQLQLRLSTLPVFSTVSMVGFIAFTAFAYASLHRGAIFNEHLISAGYIKRYASDQVVGVFNSGVAGFVNPNVINLDGKVNKEILPYLESDNIDRYLEDNQQITLILDWSKLIRRRISEQYLNDHWIECIDGSGWFAVGFCRKESQQTEASALQ